MTTPVIAKTGDGRRLSLWDGLLLHVRLWPGADLGGDGLEMFNTYLTGEPIVARLGDNQLNQELEDVLLGMEAGATFCMRLDIPDRIGSIQGVNVLYGEFSIAAVTPSDPSALPEDGIRRRYGPSSGLDDLAVVRVLNDVLSRFKRLDAEFATGRVNRSDGDHLLKLLPDNGTAQIKQVFMEGSDELTMTFPYAALETLTAQVKRALEHLSGG